MKISFYSKILSILLTTLWIGASEFFRNQVLLNSHWTKKYESIGQAFPAQPINGVVWMIWSLTFSIVLAILLRRFSVRETILLGWVIGFFMMWLVIGNLGLLPFGMLWVAVPLSLLEVSIAVRLLQQFNRT